MQMLALVPEANGTRACLEAATGAAKSQPGSCIVALHVRVEPLKLLTSDEEVAVQRLREIREGTADRRAEATRSQVEQWRQETHPELLRCVRYEEVAGREEEEVLRASRDADLLVMARPTNLDGHDAFHAAMFSSRKSLLLAPADWRLTADLERHILIAWKESRQAHRAVEGAMPWLRKAEKVTVLTVHKPGAKTDPSNLLEFLSREGVEARLIEGERIGGRTSARILATVEEVTASLIVMGAYRYASFVEWALGKTTQRTIAQAKVPLMLAH
ncbi:MAG TPA: universal stress protein [Sphingomicrobium sp.]|nr:universal stress protein [Sphingomicrobium sp.]